MKTSKSFLIPILLASMLIPLSSGWGQQKQNLLVQQKNSSPVLSIFVAGSYFGQNFSDVNAVYNTIEHNFSLPTGSNFKNTYSVLAGVRISPSNTQAVQGEFGGDIFKSTKANSVNYLQMYYTGGSYLLRLPIQMAAIYGGGGLGYVWLNTQRTYSSTLGVAQVNAQLAQIHALFGLEFFDQSGVSFSLEGRYNYASTIRPERADLNFTMKGMSGGIQIGIPIIM
jgi:hypothetical protein